MSQLSNTSSNNVASGGSSVPTAEGESRSLTARSVVLSVLLGTDPPRLPVQLLVRTTELFGIAEGAARTALSRLRDAGVLSAEDGWYAISSPQLLARQARQSASREAATGEWGEPRLWMQALVAPAGRRQPAARAALRAALAGARLGELREGVWLRPDNLGGRPAVSAEPADGVVWLRSTLDDAEEAALAGRLWDLAAWATRAEALVRRMDVLIDPLERHDRGELAEGFVLSADVLRHFQADPLLPAEILPPGWPGELLRQRYDTYDAAYRTVLAEWFAEQL